MEPVIGGALGLSGRTDGVSAGYVCDSTLQSFCVHIAGHTQGAEPVPGGAGDAP